MEQTDDLTRLRNGQSDALMEQTDDPAELARTLLIYWRIWLWQLGMMDDNVAIDVITMVLCKAEVTDVQSVGSGTESASAAGNGVSNNHK